MPPVHRLKQAEEHPFGNIEVCFPGNCVKPAVLLEIRLDRQVLTPQRAEMGVGDPGRIPKHEDGLRQLADNAIPVGDEKSCANKARSVSVSPIDKGSARAIDIFRVNLGSEGFPNGLESMEPGKKKVANPTSGFQHCRWLQPLLCEERATRPAPIQVASGNRRIPPFSYCGSLSTERIRYLSLRIPSTFPASAIARAY